MLVEEFPLPKTEMAGMSKFPGMQDRKTAEVGKNTLGPIGGEKREKIGHLKKKVFLSGGKTKCWLEKKLVS